MNQSIKIVSVWTLIITIIIGIFRINRFSSLSSSSSLFELQKIKKELQRTKEERDLFNEQLRWYETGGDKFKKMNPTELKKHWLNLAKTKRWEELLQIESIQGIGKTGALAWKDDKRNRNIFHWLVLYGNFEYLEDLGLNINSEDLLQNTLLVIDYNGDTVLDIAVTNNDQQSLEFLYKLCIRYDHTDKAFNKYNHLNNASVMDILSKCHQSLTTPIYTRLPIHENKLMGDLGII